MFSDCCTICQTPASGFGLKSADQALRAPHARPLSSLAKSYSIALEMPAVPWSCRIRRTQILLFSSNLERFARLYSLRGTRGSISAMRAVQRPDAARPLFEKRTEPAGATPTEVSFGPFRLLRTQFLLLEGDKPVPLGSRALEILIALLERHGELVSKQDLMARVWANVFVEPANLTVHMSALRRALRDGQDGNRFIVNIPGRGYCFVGSVAISAHEN